MVLGETLMRAASSGTFMNGVFPAIGLLQAKRNRPLAAIRFGCQEPSRRLWRHKQVDLNGRYWLSPGKDQQ